jgi:DNA gyrase subunit B
MPSIIEKGYLYIAQPPLYKVKKGSSEVYLKDDEAMNEFLLSNISEGAILKLSSGEQVAGPDLLEMVRKVIRFNLLINNIKRHSDPVVIEALALSGALAKGKPDDIANETLKYLNRNYPESKQWAIENDVAGIGFSRMVKGVKEKLSLPLTVINSPESKKLAEIAKDLKEILLGENQLTYKEETARVNGALDLYNKVLELGKKGCTISRFKGLGEMNAEQLWETTLDPSARTLLQVKIEQADEADQIFSTLMGDVVEPRRDFIQKNALNVSNLDA